MSRLILIVLLFALNVVALPPEAQLFENIGGFVQGTVVHTFRGPDTIQNIRVNDRLLSLDPSTGRVVDSRVVNVHQVQVDELAKVVVGSDKFYVNPDHCFYVADTGEWVAARRLVPGKHVLLSKGGQYLSIDSVQVVRGRDYIYDLTLEELHNYFVGKNQVLVHNFAFVIPLFTWTIGEGLALLTSATLAAVTTTAVVYAIKELTGRDPGDFSHLSRNFKPQSRIEGDRAKSDYPVDLYIRSRGNKLTPNSDAQGDHSTFRPGNYETWRDKGQGQHPNDPSQWESVKRYRGNGKPHNGVEPPYINEGGKGRSARPEECMNGCNKG